MTVQVRQEIREFLLLCGAKLLVFQVAIQKFIEKVIQNYNLACCSVQV